MSKWGTNPMIVEKRKVSKTSNVYGGWVNKQRRAQALVESRLSNRRSPTPMDSSGGGYGRSSRSGAPSRRAYNNATSPNRSPFKSPGQSNLLKALGPPAKGAFGASGRTTRGMKAQKTFTKDDLDRAVSQALEDSLAKTTAQMSMQGSGLSTFNTLQPLESISPPKKTNSPSKSNKNKPRVQRELQGAAAASGGLSAAEDENPYGAMKSVAQKKKKPLTLPPTQRTRAPPAPPKEVTLSPNQRTRAPPAPPTELTLPPTQRAPARAAALAAAAPAQMHHPDHPHIRAEVVGGAAAQGLAYVNTGTHNIPQARPKEHVTLNTGFGNSHMHGNKQINHGQGPRGNRASKQLVNQLVATTTAPGGAPRHVVDLGMMSAEAASGDPSSEFAHTVGALRNRLIDTGGHTLAPHYGHGHEDKDTLDHFGLGMNVATQGVGAKAERSMHDHTTNMIDAGKGLISGVIVAPHYGHGHENKDSYDHFGVGTMMSKDGAMSKREQFGEHYGGGHEDKDTFSHLKDGFVPDEGFDIVEGLAHYGGGHENKDTADHFGLGMMLAAPGGLNHTEEFGHHWKGHENKDTASHMGPGMIPDKDLSFQSGAQHGDSHKPMVRRKVRGKATLSKSYLKTLRKKKKFLMI